MRIESISQDKYVEELKNLAEHRQNDGDYLGAISTLKNLLKYKDNDEMIYYNIACNYIKMSLYKYAFNYLFKFLNICKKSDEPLAYNAIGTCFYRTNQIDTAGLYYTKQIEMNKDGEFDFHDDMIEYCENMSNEQIDNDFYVCYPDEKIKSDYRFIKSEQLFFQGKIDDGVDELDKIQKGDDRYIEAQLKIASQLLLEKKNDDLLILLKALYNDYPNENVVFVNYFGYLANYGKTAECYELYKRIDELHFTSYFECYKLALAFCDLNDHKNIEKYLLLALNDRQNDPPTTYLLAIAEYNLKNFKKSKELFKNLQLIVGDVVSNYYYNLAKESERVNDGEELPYTFNLPRKEFDKWAKEVEDIICGNTKIKLSNYKRVIELADWLFSFNSKLSEDFAITLAFSNCKPIKEYIVSKLIEIEFEDMIKSQIISQLVAKGYKRRVGVVFAGVYRKISLQPINVEVFEKHAKMFNMGYSRAFGVLSPFSGFNAGKLKDVTYELYIKMTKNSEIESLLNEKLIASFISFATNSVMAKSVKFTASAYGTDSKKLKRLIEILKDCYD